MAVTHPHRSAPPQTHTPPHPPPPPPPTPPRIPHPPHRPPQPQPVTPSSPQAPRPSGYWWAARRALRSWPRISINSIHIVVDYFTLPTTPTPPAPPNIRIGWVRGEGRGGPIATINPAPPPPPPPSPPNPCLLFFSFVLYGCRGVSPLSYPPPTTPLTPQPQPPPTTPIRGVRVGPPPRVPSWGVPRPRGGGPRLAVRVGLWGGARHIESERRACGYINNAYSFFYRTLFFTMSRRSVRATRR